jgi:hypothetical protein
VFEISPLGGQCYVRANARVQTEQFFSLVNTAVVVMNGKLIDHIRGTSQRLAAGTFVPLELVVPPPPTDGPLFENGKFIATKWEVQPTATTVKRAPTGSTAERARALPDNHPLAQYSTENPLPDDEPLPDLSQADLNRMGITSNTYNIWKTVRKLYVTASGGTLSVVDMAAAVNRDTSAIHGYIREMKRWGLIAT